MGTKMHFGRGLADHAVCGADVRRGGCTNDPTRVTCLKCEKIVDGELAEARVCECCKTQRRATLICHITNRVGTASRATDLCENCMNFLHALPGYDVRLFSGDIWDLRKLGYRPNMVEANASES